jgi:transcription termination factor Rho
MSQSPEDTHTPAADEAVEKPAAKKAAKKATAKKAAKKTTAKKAAKKAAAKKTTAKKAAVIKLAEAAEKVAAADTVAEVKPVAEVREDGVVQKPVPRDEPAPAEDAREITPPPGGQQRDDVPSHVEAAGETPAPPENRHGRDEEAGDGGNSQRRFGRVPGGGPVGAPPSQDGQANDNRSKKRREKRKRRREKQRPPVDGAPPARREEFTPNPNGNRPQQLTGPKVEADGLLELAPKGFGFLRVPAKNFEQARDDVFVPPEILRRYNLRDCQWIHGVYQDGPRGPQLVEVTQVNGQTPDEAAKAPHFDELKAINPNKRISFETTPDRYTTRVVDIMSPIGRGQRGLIVSPPRSGKTTMLLHMAEAIREKYDEQIHLMVLLVDERPEEVTEFRRALPGAEIYASSNDEQPRNHCRVAELAIERAKRLVESGQHVFLLMDSITRLARAYNNAMARGGGRNRATGSGGVMIGALEVPRRLFAAARNTRGGGSLTIVATALIQTNSRADEAIFMEFKGTGNMELVLDRKIAENYIYPAVDIFKSGTRREELLLPDHMLHKINLIRRGLSGHRPAEAMERLLFFQKKFPNNPQMLLEIKG